MNSSLHSKKSRRGVTRSTSRAGLRDGGSRLGETICTDAGRSFNKDGDEVCKWIKLATFKSIYKGTEVKFVKLLFFMLKKQIGRFIEQKNALAKTHMLSNKITKAVTKVKTSTSVMSVLSSGAK